MERRFSAPKSNATPVITRAEGDKKKIKGYASVFYDPNDARTEYWLWDDIVERIRPEAFARALKEQQDVRGLFNHSMDWVLGRSSAGTLRLSVDERGLYYEIDENEKDPQWQSVAAKIDRGDIDGSSFAFRATSTTWETIDYEGRKVDVRWINDVDLFDVGPVTFPAYDGSTATRSRVSLQEYQELIQERSKQLYEIESVRMRARLLEV
jgi:HK97 family phage prohead protease